MSNKVFAHMLIACGLVTVATTIAAPDYIIAEPSNNNFYEKNAALSTFDSDITQSENSQLQILRTSKREKELKNRENIELLQAKEKAALYDKGKSQVINENGKEDNKLSAQEKILAQFGDPAKDVPILGEEKAPTPFKAMMAAFEAGDEKLAFQYARQYVRHINNVKERSNQVMALQALAMEKEGLIGKGDWGDDARYAPQRALLAEELGEDDTKKLVGKVEKAASIDPQIQAFLNEAAKAESVVLDEGEIEAFGEDQNTGPVSKQEKTLRAEARAVIQGKTPIDPKGMVDLYFFLRTRDNQSHEMSVPIESIWRAIQANPKLKSKVRIIGLTLDFENQEAIDYFRYTTKTHFPIANGVILSKKFNIKNTPVIIAVARSSGEAIIEEGTRTFYYLDELVKYMQGAK